MNYYAATAHSGNSFTVLSLGHDVGDSYLHSQWGRGIVVHREKCGFMDKLIVRTDITLDQLIERI